MDLAFRLKSLTKEHGMNPRDIDRIPPVQSVYCNRCKGSTRHECLSKTSREEVESDDEGFSVFVEVWLYLVWKCMGCDSVTLEERYSNSAFPSYENDDRHWDCELHPQRNHQKIGPKQFSQLPKKLTNIYKESLTAFNSKALVLAATGLRSLIEGICTDKELKGRNLEKRIDELARILPRNIVVNLHSLRFMGNTAIHDLDPPDSYHLRLAIEICEDILNFLYQLDYKTARLGSIIGSDLRQTPRGNQPQLSTPRITPPPEDSISTP